jgi:hypothetical protein
MWIGDVYMNSFICRLNLKEGKYGRERRHAKKQEEACFSLSILFQKHHK